ncbi:MAG: helix-turn-helix domain-containing protein [Pseudomonadota bacterium]|jgi:transcriptional regulator with XRE-family HTH domain|nr:helix-turn-helix domain-containing protein [Pseudomonadota bacterium]
MSPERPLLLFPLVFKRLRKSRGLLQKTTALDLGLDATVLCAIEKGTRAPLGDDLLKRAAQLFCLSGEEVRQLQWAAHHDRLVGHLEDKGATETEVEFISTGLHALRHLQPQQINGLMSSLQEIEKSASLVASLGKSNPLAEATMN